MKNAVCDVWGVSGSTGRVSASSSRFGADRAIEKINLTRRYQTDGFGIFNYGVNEANELLPQLGSGITRSTK